MKDLHDKLIKITPSTEIWLSRREWLSRIDTCVRPFKPWTIETVLKLVNAPSIALVESLGYLFFIKDYKVYIVTDTLVRSVKKDEYANISSLAKGNIKYQSHTLTDETPEPILELISVIDAYELINDI